MFEIISDRLKSSKRFVFVTGAGISQESGVPTFRGKDGLWRKYDAMRLATIDAFYDNPKLVWDWYAERRQNIISARPNAGHSAIAELQKYKDVIVLTQNIDGLHQRSGSNTVLELHGSIIRIKCTVCDFQKDFLENFDILPPKCNCGAILRPDVVWFGEPLPLDVWTSAIKYAGSCDVMIVAGTSLVVSPANTLPTYAKQNDALLIEINPEKTLMSDDMDLSIRGTSADVIPKLVTSIRD